MERNISELRNGDLISMREDKPSFKVISDSVLFKGRYTVRVLHIPDNDRIILSFPRDLSVIYYENTNG